MTLDVLMIITIILPVRCLFERIGSCLLLRLAAWQVTWTCEARRTMGASWPTFFEPSPQRVNLHIQALRPPNITMSSQRSSVVPQDFLARIRYSNALPPPPCPPKLLDIPNTGLSSGQYTSASFASRLAREQPLNIEADAELGMPIDLVGIPKVFDGDESGKKVNRAQARDSH